MIKLPIVLTMGLTLAINAHSATVPFNQPITAFNLIVDAEGYHPTIYIDTLGNKTCGYGFMVKAHPDICKVKDKYRHDIYLHEILPRYEAIAREYHNSPNPVISAVLTDIAYNIGTKIFTFKKMRLALIKGDYELASKELKNSTYCRQTKTRCERNALILQGIK